jgi:antitoxin (DNA-binding transcriptional repressor) of toxin-antitoxin stability system
MKSLPPAANIRKIRNMSTSRRGRRNSGATVSATEAAKNFGRLVDRVREERATYVVERGGKAVARITPIDRAPFTVADFKALLAALPHADEAYLKATEDAAATHNRPRVRRNPWER